MPQTPCSLFPPSLNPSLPSCQQQPSNTDHSTCFSSSFFWDRSPKVVLQRMMAQLTISYAFSLPSNLSTSTSFLSSFLQSSKKRCTWSSKCLGNCSISVMWETDLSLLATEMILSSSSPWSIMRITPITFASTRHRVSTLAEQITRMSRGSLSKQQVCGMKPQLEGQWTALNKMRSNRSSPLSLSNQYFTLLSVGISITAVTTSGEAPPYETACHGLLVKRGFLPDELIKNKQYSCWKKRVQLGAS